MLRRRVSRFFAILALLSLNGFAAKTQGATACVWKVTGPNGGVAYLGGSVHSLRKSDYPLPASYTQAFDASTRMAFEVDERALDRSSQSLLKEGTYRKGDSLKNHVDPRTYDYMRRVFGLMNIPEKTYSQYRPWLIVLMLQSMSSRRLLPEIGVDQYFMKRAAKRSMPVVGLESVDEHSRVYVGLSDRQSEILLLITFIPNENPIDHDRMIKMWRRGDADGLATMLRHDSAEFPVFNERLIDARNRAWVPKIEKFLQSGQTYFVIVGAGHLGGNNGVPALLRAKGYQVEQL